MPNHTSNLLTIDTDNREIASQIKEWVKSVKDGEVSLFDFNKVISLPVGLHGSSSPSIIMTQDEIDRKKIKRDEDIKKNPWMKEWLGEEIGITQEEYDRRMLDYQVANWYDWCVKNWGTKWNAYGVGKWKGNEISFQTAWCPPVPVISKMSEIYPEVDFILEYADEGGGFLGWTTFQKGCSQETLLEWNSEDGVKLRQKLGCYYEEDDEEVEEDDEEVDKEVDKVE